MLLESAFAAFILSVGLYWPGRFFIMGWRDAKRSQSVFVCSLLVSLVFWLGAGMFLAQFGRFSRSALLSVGIVWCLFLLIYNRKRHAQIAEDALCEWGGLFVLLLCAMLIPNRGEWIIGGWDPGVYLNFGVSIAANEGFETAAVPVYQQLAEQELLQCFTRDMSGLIEAFPGVPVDPETGGYAFYFYRVTPVFYGSLFLCGGLACAVKGPLILGLLATLVLAGMLRRQRRALVVFAVVLFIAQPILLYHARVPCSEMLELVLVMGLGYLFMHRRFALGKIVGFVLMFLAVVNRVSFVFYGSLIFLAFEVGDLLCVRRRGRGHLHLLFGVIFGCAYVMNCNPDSLVKLRHIFPRMLNMSAWIWLVGTALDVAERKPAVRKWVREVSGVGVRWLFGLLPFVLLGSWVLQTNHIRLTEFWSNTPVVCGYLGWGVVLLAGAGVYGVVFCRWSNGRIRLLLWLALLLLCSLLTMSYKHTAELWPWATKRFLVYSVPLICIGAGTTLATLWYARWKWGRYVAVLGLLIVIAMNGRRMVAAWSPADFNGVGQILESVAAQVADDAVVVADHFVWGTPMQFVFGCQTINGERLKGCSEEERSGVLRFLKESDRKGVPVLFLTSTGYGPVVFGLGENDNFMRVWESEELEFSETGHHASTRDFWHADQRVRFGLYRLTNGTIGCSVGAEDSAPPGGNGKYMLAGGTLSSASIAEPECRW